MNKLNILDLFSGIGGFSFGLEKTGGFSTGKFCEVNKYCRKILKKHWPNTEIHDDIQTLTVKPRTFDVVCGGFPCQDISYAGKGAGLAGERSGLWYEMCRVINEAKPSWVIAENVSALRSRGLDEVLRSLDEIGYNAQWHCIPASAVGAPHRRDRIWIVAYPNDRGSAVWRHWELSGSEKVTSLWGFIRRGTQEFISRQWWKIESRPHGVANGVPNRVDRLKQLGNALVPQIVTIIGNAIVEAEQK